MNGETEQGSPNSTREADPQKQFHDWESGYGQWLKREIDKPQATACRSVAAAAARFTLGWCLKNQRGREDANERMWRAANIVHELYQALTPEPEKQPKLKPTNRFWQHIQFAQFLHTASVDELDYPIDARSLKNIATTYLANAFLHNPYLDWVLIDALVFTELQAYFQNVMKAKYGVVYAITGKRWKAILFRLFYVPVIFALGWIAPGALCWWLHPKFPTMSTIAAAAYYLWSIYLLARYFIGLILYRLRTGKTPRREQLERIAAMEAAYIELREDTIHVPSLRRAIERARDLGAVWDPQVFSIVDNAAARNSSTWIRQLAYREADYGGLLF